MSYTTEQVDNLHRNQQKAMDDLDALRTRLLAESSRIHASEQTREHLDHGSSRRIGMLLHALASVFSAFPPETAEPIDRDALRNVTAQLHAFLINLCGTFDNWAWAFVHRHNLMKKIGDRRGIGLFNPRTTRFMPAGLKDYLASEPIAGWQRDYLTNYRDSLAHRIPPYIPPMQLLTQDGDLWRQLWDEAGLAIKAQDWDRLDRLEAERLQLESPCFDFALAFSQTESRPVLFHAQMIADSLSVTAVGQRFLDTWHEVADPQTK